MSSFSRLGTLLLLSAAALPAIKITNITFLVNGVEQFAGPIGGSVPDALGTADYLYNGEIDVYEGPGLGPAGPAVTFGVPLTGPISFRFTNATVGCGTQDSEVTTCGKAELNFVAFITFDGPVADLGGFYGVEGSGFSNSSATFGVGIEGNDISAINGIDVNSNFVQSAAFPAGFVTSNSSNNLILAMGFVFTEMPVGAFLSLPDSLFQQIGVQDANGDGVPEPGTMAIVGAGLVGAFWFRRRMN